MIDEKKLDQLEEHLSHLASLLLHAFNLPTFSLEFDHSLEDYGHCHLHNNRIILRLTSLDGQHIYKDKTVKDTLCHELAHIVEGAHNAKHRRLLSAMLVWLERNGY